MLLAFCFSTALLLQMPEWEINTGYLPICNPLLAENSAGEMDIFIALGDHGLGGWNGTGQLLEGFPVSFERSGGNYGSPFYSNVTDPAK